LKILQVLLLAASFLIASHAKAGFITTNESELDAIFSQASFGLMPIDIRIGAASELIFPDLLDITTDTEINQLFNLHIGGLNVVNFYFVDTVNACSGFNTAIVGCGETPGNDFVVESSFAAGGFGGELLAHELVHNLGLSHSTSGLMAPSLNHNTTLTAQEVSNIRSSSLVQTNGRDFWIDINPVLIVAAATIPLPVPEPSTLMLLLLSFSFLLKNGLKKTR
jgi:hypothetical protein